MRRIKILTVTVSAALAIAVGAAQQNGRVDAQLQAAINKETVEGDLKNAIEMYKKVAQGGNRAVAAKALVRMGQCYEKLGDSEARKAYERVVREFGDQKEQVLVAQGRLSAARVAAPAGLTVRQVWAGSDEVDGSGRISPDGRYLSFISYKNGEEVAVRDLSTGENRILTHHLLGETAGADDALWSPDGKRLVYDWADYHEIRTVNPDGSAMHIVSRVADDEIISPYDWSPDGRRILAIKLKRTGTDKTGRLLWVNASDGVTEAITATAAGNRLLAHVSPDGRYIALGAGRAPVGPTEVRVVASDGSGDTVLTGHPAGEYPVGWSPDGKYVLFISKRASMPALWAIPVTNGKTQGAARMIQPLGEQVIPLGITRAGAFHYRIQTSSSDVYTASMDPATGRVISTPTPIPLPRGGHNVAPRWSPDGRRMLVTWAQDTPKVRELSALSLDSGKEQPIHARGVLTGSGWCWVEGGESVLIGQELGSGITRVNVVTGQTSTMIEGPLGSAFMFSCSANGKLVAFVDSKLRTLKMRDIESGSEKELYTHTGDGWAWLPEISPDGSQVAFLLQRSVLMIVPVAGGPVRELMRLKSPALFQTAKGLTWSPDGRYLYYLKRSDDISPYELFRIPSAGGHEESVGLKAADIRDINIAPDGKLIALSIGNMRALEIWAIENFLPAAK